MKTFREFPSLCTAFALLFSGDDNSDKIDEDNFWGIRVPEEWEHRCAKADDAANDLIDSEVGGHIDHEELEDNFSDSVSPEDDALETFVRGSHDIVGKLVSVISDGAILQEVLDSASEGELAGIFEDL